MLYQEMLLGDSPYVIGYRHSEPFPIHKHREMELIYCIKGTYRLIINREEHTINEGDLAIIGSMVAHEIPESNKQYDSTCLVIEVGPTMLGESFEQLKNESFPNPVFHLKDEKHSELHCLIKETNFFRENPTQFSNLINKGNLYKICAYILEVMVNENNNSTVSKRVSSIMNIENSLEYIYKNYYRKISVENIANLCGYSKSNFCKLFKSITGDTFHNVLNTHRIKVACLMLKNSEKSIDNIATEVGFADSKSFCRIFKTVKGVSPGTYRKSK